jgi:tRNA(Arg) A34 adenosine deaminase TadA
MKTRHVITAQCYDKKGRLLSTAKNNYNKSHPIQAHFASLVGHPARIYLHAEIHAIIKAGDKQIYKMVITRFGKDYKARNAKPCPICAAAIKAYGIKYISYTTGE